MVEIGANRQSRDPSIMPVFKLVLEVVIGVVGWTRKKDKSGEEFLSSRIGADAAPMTRTQDS